MRTHTYNTEVYNFRELVRQALNVYDLERICLDSEVVSREKDQSSSYHKIFYQWLSFEAAAGFHQIYKDFIRKEIHPLFNHADILYQTKPTFRLSYPNNLAVGEFHRDSDYNHNVNEVNIFVPLTRAEDTNTIWIESEAGAGDFAPILTKYGNFTLFRGSTLKHGNKINETGYCRVSFDFRILPKVFYKPGLKTTGQGIALEVGPQGYWSDLK